MQIDQENLAISALCRELAKVFSGEISTRNLRDLKAELLAQLRDLARRSPDREHP
ncbi:putative kinase [Bradyrhizobium sp. USDA 372]